MKNLELAAILLGLMVFSCEKTEIPVVWEMPGRESKMIEKKIDGIDFRFCLLNEQGNPETTFGEGENFTFSFSFTNNLQDNISVPTQFINSDFYRVYNQDLSDMGKPWAGLWCEYSMAKWVIELSPSDIKRLNCPWSWSESIWPDYPICLSQEGSKTYLPKGEYSTSLDFNFLYFINDTKERNIRITFKINFKIQ